MSHDAVDNSVESVSARLRDLRLRLWQSLGLLVLVIAISAAGFRVLNPDLTWHAALWDTLNLISTVGSLGDLSEAEQVWAMLVIVFGLGATLYGFGNLSALLTSGEVLRVFERHKVEREIAALEGHIIICGCGNVGRQVATTLRGHPKGIVVIDQDPDTAAEAADEDLLVVHGDCTQESVLERAGIARAAGLITTLDTDTANVFVVLTARGLNERLHIVARADLPRTVRQLERAGADRVIVPSQIAAHQLATLVQRPEMAKFMDRAMQGREVELVEIRVADHPWMTDRTLGELELPRRFEIIVLEVVHADGSQVFNPGAETTLKASDMLLVVTARGGVERLQEIADPDHA